MFSFFVWIWKEPFHFSFLEFLIFVILRFRVIFWILLTRNIMGDCILWFFLVSYKIFKGQFLRWFHCDWRRKAEMEMGNWHYNLNTHFFLHLLIFSFLFQNCNIRSYRFSFCLLYLNLFEEFLRNFKLLPDDGLIMFCFLMAFGMKAIVFLFLLECTCMTDLQRNNQIYPFNLEIKCIKLFFCKEIWY